MRETGTGLDAPDTTVRRGRALLAVAALALASACAAEPPRPASPQAPAFADDFQELQISAEHIDVRPQPVTRDTLVCRKEVPVGTHRARRRCFTRGQLERIREDTQLWLRSGGREGAPIVGH